MQYYLSISPRTYSARITLEHIDTGHIGTTTLDIKSLNLESLSEYCLPLSSNKAALFQSVIRNFDADLDIATSIVALSALATEHMDLQSIGTMNNTVVRFPQHDMSVEQFQFYRHSQTAYYAIPIYVMIPPDVSLVVLLQKGEPVSTALVRNQHLLPATYNGQTNESLWEA